MAGSRARVHPAGDRVGRESLIEPSTPPCKIYLLLDNYRPTAWAEIPPDSTRLQPARFDSITTCLERERYSRSNYDTPHASLYHLFLASISESPDADVKRSRPRPEKRTVVRVRYNNPMNLAHRRSAEVPS